jgi:hypothetical protein
MRKLEAKPEGKRLDQFGNMTVIRASVGLNLPPSPEILFLISCEMSDLRHRLQKWLALDL